MKRKVLSMLLVATMVAGIVTGCGGNGGISSTQGSANGPTSSDAFANQKEYTLSEYLDSGETVWFTISELGGKDERVNGVYVIEEDGTMYYCDTHSDWGIVDLDWTVGDVEQMTDEEIISIIKQEYEKYYSQIVERRIPNDYQERDLEFKTYTIANKVFGKMNISNREFLNDWYAALYEPYRKDIEPAKYKLTLISDSTGNNTEKEVFMFQETVPWGGVYNVELDVWEAYSCNISEMTLAVTIWLPVLHPLRFLSWTKLVQRI